MPCISHASKLQYGSSCTACAQCFRTFLFLLPFRATAIVQLCETIRWEQQQRRTTREIRGHGWSTKHTPAQAHSMWRGFDASVSVHSLTCAKLGRLESTEDTTMVVELEHLEQSLFGRIGGFVCSSNKGARMICGAVRYNYLQWKRTREVRVAIREPLGRRPLASRDCTTNSGPMVLTL